MTEDEIKAEMAVYNKIIADNYALYCETPKDNGRTDTLIKTIEELERTKKQLAIAVEGLKDVIETVKTGLVVCDACGFQGECRDCAAQIVAEQTLDEIKELEK